MGVRRIGAFVDIDDGSDCRYFIRITSIQWLCDADPCHDACLIRAAGHTIYVPYPLEQIRKLMQPYREFDDNPTETADISVGRNCRKPQPKT